jgi:hypothetical protein
MSSEDNVYSRIVIDLEGMHPTYARQAILMANQIQSWFEWRHIAFVLELVESGPYLDEGGAHVWQVDKAKKFATKAEAVEWCGDRHVDRGGLVFVQSLVEKDGELKTLGLIDNDHSLLETWTPSEWLRRINEYAAKLGAVDGFGEIDAKISIHRVK